MLHRGRRQLVLSSSPININNLDCKSPCLAINDQGETMFCSDNYVSAYLNMPAVQKALQVCRIAGNSTGMPITYENFVYFVNLPLLYVLTNFDCL